MSIEATLKRVQSKLWQLEGIRGQKVLDQDEKDKLIDLEKQYQEGSEQNGLIKVVNEGFWATFQRDDQVVLVLEQEKTVIPRIGQLLEMQDDRGRKIGEWVGEKVVLGSDGRPLVKIGDFVLHEGVKVTGRPHLVIPEVEFSFLDGIRGIESVTSCSPSAPSDMLIRDWLKLHDEGLLTRIVGFNIDRDDLD